MQSCGKITYNVALQDGSEAPDFIQVELLTDMYGDANYWLTVWPEAQEHAGIYNLQLEYSLEEYAAFVPSQYNYFKVNVLPVPDTIYNTLPVMLVAPNDVTVEVGDEATINLAAYDADGDEVRPELIFRDALSRAFCRDCFVHNDYTQ